MGTPWWLMTSAFGSPWPVLGNTQLKRASNCVPSLKRLCFWHTLNLTAKLFPHDNTWCKTTLTRVPQAGFFFFRQPSAGDSRRFMCPVFFIAQEKEFQDIHILPTSFVHRQSPRMRWSRDLLLIGREQKVRTTGEIVPRANQSETDYWGISEKPIKNR